MQSFQTEIENPIVQKDIIDLERKIRLFREGKIHEEKFRSLRLARGVYGQRQQGVQMVRIKLPYGKMTLNQWQRIADISDEYSTGNLHFTTRQDIQIHFVSLERTPELWAKLEEENITLREACGNTVRNITASVTAGIDKNEPFDITPYAHATFEYFLRNPICQEMGRKFKMSFSNTDEDTALSYMHDLGFIPKIVDGKKGFKVMLGGGLGAQPMLAHVAHEFLEENQIIPYIEAVLRVFDRNGERNSRNKARLKYLIAKIGFEAFIELVKEEHLALKSSEFRVLNSESFSSDLINQVNTNSALSIQHLELYESWLKTNTFEQKQVGFHGIYIRVPLGNINTKDSRGLIADLRGYVADDVRVTINQGLLLRYVATENLPYIYNVLEKYNLAEAGANSIANITACPGTDTCNLAISDSTQITLEFEKVIRNEFADLINESDMKIKISGCMNACGQHSMAHIGFHGSSLKSAGKVLPALQVLLGGGTVGNGVGRVSDKVIKVPSKRGPDVLRIVLSDYENNALEGEYFNDYYDRQGEKYFYTLLKPLADLITLQPNDFIDWGQTDAFATEIGVGECASVIIDLVATLLYEAEEKHNWAKEAFAENRFADAIYNAYSAQIQAAKALLLDKGVHCNTQHGVIKDFATNYDKEFEINFKEQIMQINQNEPTKEFATQYLETAENFVKNAATYRENALAVA